MAAPPRPTPRPFATALVAATLLALVAGAVAPVPAGASRPKVRVVAAFYPLAWVAEQVGGPRVSVANLTPAGTEPHDLELTPDQRDDIEDADLVVVLGDGFQPAVEDAAEARDGRTVELLDRLPTARGGGKVLDEDPDDEDHDDEDHDDEDHDHAGVDPHVWLDPVLMAGIVDETAAALTAVDPKGRKAYAAGAADLRTRLAALDERFTTGLADCERRLVVTAHDAFGYLAAAYDLRQEGVAGMSPDAEPNPRRLGELADIVEAQGVTTVFTEELVSPAVAKTLAREAGGLRTDTLNPLEGLTARELERGDDYVTVMDRNLKRLRRALGCT